MRSPFFALQTRAGLLEQCDCQLLHRRSVERRTEALRIGKELAFDMSRRKIKIQLRLRKGPWLQAKVARSDWHDLHFRIPSPTQW